MKGQISINGKRYSADHVRAIVADGSVEMPDSLAEVFEFLANWYDDSDYILQQTSGSTGTPSAIKLKKQNMWHSAKSTNTFFSLIPESNILLALPAAYIAGKMMILRALAGSMNLHVVHPSGTPEIPDKNFSFAAFVPMQLENLLESGIQCQHIETIILGGAEVSENLIEIAGGLSSRVYATYGMTETCSHIAVRRLNGSNPDEFYRTLPGVQATLDTEGRICINAPKYSPGTVHTTDLGIIPEPGMLGVVGRDDFIINSGGVKINPFPWEHYFQKQIQKIVLLIPVPDKRLGNRAVVIIEAEETEALRNKVKEIIIHLRKDVPLDREPVFLSEFPRNQSLKVDRKALIKRFQ
jgi:O-succinylbenzoic acid--CoA ligase